MEAWTFIPTPNLTPQSLYVCQNLHHFETNAEDEDEADSMVSAAFLLQRCLNIPGVRGPGQHPKIGEFNKWKFSFFFHRK